MSKIFRTLAGQELFRIDNPDKEAELEREAKRFFEITEKAHEEFDYASFCLLCAYVDSNGAGQLAMINDELTKERKCWVVPIAETEENKRILEQIKQSENFDNFVEKYQSMCPLSAGVAMVVQTIVNEKIKTVYRLRDDVRMGIGNVQ